MLTLVDTTALTAPPWLAEERVSENLQFLI
jgi:hypothetical protein